MLFVSFLLVDLIGCGVSLFEVLVWGDVLAACLLLRLGGYLHWGFAAGLLGGAFGVSCCL